MQKRGSYPTEIKEPLNTAIYFIAYCPKEKEPGSIRGRARKRAAVSESGFLFKS